MEDIALMVSASLARHGFIPRVDYRRLQWSTWFRCESSLNVATVPSTPGIFALANEQADPVLAEKRQLTVFQVSESEDVGMALGRLFLPETPSPFYVRYALIEDPEQRHASHRELKEWMTSSANGLRVADEFANLTVHSFSREKEISKDPLASARKPCPIASAQ